MISLCALRIIFIYSVLINLAFSFSQNIKNSNFHSGTSCTANEYGTYRVTLELCDGTNWQNVQPKPKRIETKTPQGFLGKNCLDIKQRGLSHGDGKYMIDPLGQGPDKAFAVYCDMTSFGGGWTMCYTTDSHVNLKTELTTNLARGYRADCNNVPFTGIMFVDEKTKHKTAFTKNGSPLTFKGNYNKKADTYGLWTAHGVASSKYRYQMLICDTSYYKGLHFSGNTNSCYKQCDNWCGDTASAYFRTAAVSDKSRNGVAFNENGHRPRPNRLISAGIR